MEVRAMSRAIRTLFTVVVLLLVLLFRGTRAAALAAVIGGAWLRRTWVTKPSRGGTLGRRTGPPRWVRYATGRVAGRSLPSGRQHTGDLFEAGPAAPPTVERWW
jgi:hypothetical protein